MKGAAKIGTLEVGTGVRVRAMKNGRLRTKM